MYRRAGGFCYPKQTFRQTILPATPLVVDSKHNPKRMTIELSQQSMSSNHIDVT